MKLLPNLICYHQGCPDGIAGAWPFWREYKNKYKTTVDMVGCTYGDSPPDVTNKDVIIVDFSFPRNVLLEMAKKYNVTERTCYRWKLKLGVDDMVS
jgi:hypothetical protein